MWSNNTARIVSLTQSARSLLVGMTPVGQTRVSAHQDRHTPIRIDIPKFREVDPYVFNNPNKSGRSFSATCAVA
jgi:hypothetical protein